MADDDTVVLEAKFDRNVRTYWLISGTLLMTVIVVTIPLIPIWLAIGFWATERYLQNMHCTLTDRSLKLRKGIFIRTEKTVPLDKITDLGFVQGPVMRALGLESISVETAGQSGPGSLVSVIGIENARGFRDQVLAQREIYLRAGPADNANPASQPVTVAAIDAPHAALLSEIRDTLLRIEKNTAADSEKFDR
jgi:putative membrane protein